MAKRTLRTKLLVTYIAAGILPIMIISGWGYYEDQRAIGNTIKASLDMAPEVVAESLAVYDRYLLLAGRMAANNPDVIAAIKSGDAPALKLLARQVMALTEGLTFLTISQADGTVLARGHSDQAGDNIANQETFKAAVGGREIVGMESGLVAEDRLTVRGAFPVLADGRPVGVVSLGYPRATSGFVDSIKKMLGAECTIFADDTRAATTIINNGQRAVGTKMANPAVIETVLKRGQNFQDKNVILGHSYDTLYWPIRDIKNEVVGMFFIGIPSEPHEEAQSRALKFSLIAVLLTAVIAFLVGWLMSRNVTVRINQVVDTLTESTGRVTTAARSIDDACRKLAGSSESQSSSLLQSTSALEELAAQSKGNAANAVQASEVMGQTYQSARAAAEAMTEMTATMTSIRTSSDQVSGIIKTIEDISFQTNLLALNASVEAARAGEHGLGFAVVAEEVRNLAQRAAEAAGNTNALITASVSYSHKGEAVAAQVSDSIAATLSSTNQVNTLVKGVEEASNEQSTGIGQIKQAVTTIDNAVQDISGTAQSTAEVSHELTQQVDMLEQAMLDLTALVDPRKAAALRGF